MTSQLLRRFSLPIALILGIFLLLPYRHAFASDATDVLALVNQHRAANGLGPVCLDAQLTEAARAHSQDMQTNNYFDHTALNGSKPWDRIQATGYRGTYFSENIAFGYRSAAEVFEGWRTSPGHNANMLSPSATEMGIARVGDYWTQVFSNGEACTTAPIAPTTPTPAPVIGGGKSPDVTTPVVITTPAPVVVNTPAPPSGQQQPPPPPQSPVVQEQVVWVEQETHSGANWSWDAIPAGYTCYTETWVDEFGVTWECTTCYSS
jgi:hypothetical protein